RPAGPIGVANQDDGAEGDEQQAETDQGDEHAHEGAKIPMSVAEEEGDALAEPGVEVGLFRRAAYARCSSARRRTSIFPSGSLPGAGAQNHGDGQAGEVKLSRSWRECADSGNVPDTLPADRNRRRVTIPRR